MVDENHSNSELTDAEAELYDRQIRLWGLDSQKRLRAAKVLLIGLNGLGAEIGKNIILAGVKQVTFLDHRELTVEDGCSNFLAPKSEIGKNRAEASLKKAQTLNPMVEVRADAENVDQKWDSYYFDFDIVCATECTISQLKKINKACRKKNIKFLVGDVWGTFGYTFADLVVHEFAEDTTQSKKIQVSDGDTTKEKYEKITVTVKRKETFVPFENILNVEELPKQSEAYYLLMILLNYREKYGKDPSPAERHDENLKKEAGLIVDKYQLGTTIDNLIEGEIYSQVSPVCAIVGGVLSQDIIKTVSQKESPHNNVFIFNPDTMCGKILKLGRNM